MTQVRPGFRRWLRILLPPIVLILAAILWGDLEARRFREAANAVERRQFPASPIEPAEDGSRFFAAAAVLAEVPTVFPSAQTTGAIRDALATGMPADPSIRQAADETLRVNALTLDMADRASGTQLAGTRGGRLMMLRSVPVWSQVMPVLSLRTLEHVARGDAASAAKSLVATLHFLRGASADAQSFAAAQQAHAVRGPVADLAVMLQHCDFSDVDLEQIDQALGDLFRPGDLQRLIVGQSQFLYSNVSMYNAQGLLGDLVRPARYRVATGIALSAAKALDIADRPWPERVRGMADLPVRHVWFAPKALRTISGDATRQVFQGLTENFVDGVTAVNAARTALAIERYRRLQGDYPQTLSEVNVSRELSLDPFTGASLKYVRRGGGYVLYSVGRDGQDDGGDLGPVSKAVMPGSIGRDVGIAVRR